MEVESINHEDVAEPDAVVSGAAGTGQEHKIQTRIVEKAEGNNQNELPKRVVIGLGVLYNGKMLPRTISEAAYGHASSPAGAESAGDLIFSLFERDERIQDRLQKKIDRLDCRIRKLEDRRRSQ